MEIKETAVQDVYEISPRVFEDERGYFFESYNKLKLQERGIEIDFVQDNESKSEHGVLRGLHFQTGDAAQTKLVRCVKGKIIDVAVDIRPDSPTYLQHVMVELSEENKKQLLIHKDCAHGFIVLSDEAIVQYKVDAYYAPDKEGSIIWNDPALNITWPLSENDIILSEKDQKNPLFNER